ncbi:hypothetical protein DFH28DRAFT_927636 [Melampsora americana]|nr:hypothetical protein DFH28DRAFT_927636 [Melampsora americana]
MDYESDLSDLTDLSDLDQAPVASPNSLSIVNNRRNGLILSSLRSDSLGLHLSINDLSVAQDSDLRDDRKRPFLRLSSKGLFLSIGIISSLSIVNNRRNGLILSSLRSDSLGLHLSINDLSVAQDSDLRDDRKRPFLRLSSKGLFLSIGIIRCSQNLQGLGFSNTLCFGAVTPEPTPASPGELGLAVRITDLEGLIDEVMMGLELNLDQFEHLSILLI